jgi:hypothetical protein
MMKRRRSKIARAKAAHPSRRRDQRQPAVQVPAEHAAIAAVLALPAEPHV